MAIKFLGNLSDLTFSRWKRPREPWEVVRNVLKFSIWGALGTGCACVSALFSRGVIERNGIAPYLFKASLISCETFTFVAVFISYELFQMPMTSREKRTPFIKKLNEQALSLEKALYLTPAITVIAAILARDFFKTPPTIKTIADHSIHPIFWIGITSIAIRLFHFYQHKQLGNI